MTYIVKFQWQTQVLTTARSTKVFPGHCMNDQQLEIANKIRKIRNTYITETITDRIEIPMANLGFTAMESSKKCQLACVRLPVVENSRSAIGILMLLSYFLRHMYVFFAVIGCCCNNLETASLKVLEKNPFSRSWKVHENRIGP